MATVVDQLNAPNSTFNTVGRDQYIHNVTHNPTYNVTHVGSSGQVASSSRGQPPPPTPGFNDAPVDLLSVHFTGRQQELTLIAHAFARPRREIPLRCVLYGDQGVGKSQLTYKWSKSTFSRGENMYVMWMSATTVERLDQGFSKLLHLVNHPHQFQSQQTMRLTVARRWLEEVDSGNWLLVLDNVSSKVLGFLREHLPRKNGRGSILFTTRTKNIAIALASAAGEQHEIVQVPMLDVQDGAELFCGHFRDEEIDVPSDKVEQIVKSVGCLPLAISHAAAHMKQSKRTIDEMLALYQSKNKIHAISWHNSLSEYEHKSVTATFENQIEDLEEKHPDASNLLKVLAYFDPESIPLDMLVTGATAISSQASSSSSPKPDHGKAKSIVRKIKDKVLGRGERKGKSRIEETNTPQPLFQEMASLLAIIQSPTEFRNAITILEAQCLTAYQNSLHSTLRIHDVIQVIVLEKTKKSNTHQQWFECAVLLACNAFNEIGDHRSPPHWPQCEALIPHIQSLTIRQEISTTAKARLFVANTSFGWYVQSRGRYREAEEVYVRLLADEEQSFGPEGLRTLATMYNLGVIYREQGRYDDAEALLQRVLQRCKKKLGSDHVKTLSTMYSLAYVYYSQHRDEESEKLFKKVRQARQKLLGLEHMETLDTRNMLANVYCCQHRFDEAEALYKQVLQTMEEQLGPDHIEATLVMNNLAFIYHEQKRYSAAEEVFERVLRIKEEQLGSDHPSTLLGMQNLALVYDSQGRYKDAEELLLHVWARRQEVLGPSHPVTRRTISFLESMYEKPGRLDDASTVRGHLDYSR